MGLQWLARQRHAASGLEPASHIIERRDGQGSGVEHLLQILRESCRGVLLEDPDIPVTRLSPENIWDTVWLAITEA